MNFSNPFATNTKRYYSVCIRSGSLSIIRFRTAFTLIAFNQIVPKWTVIVISNYKSLTFRLLGYTVELVLLSVGGGYRSRTDDLLRARQAL